MPRIGGGVLLSRVTINGIDTHYELRGEGMPLLYFRGGYGGISSTLQAEERSNIAGFGESVRVIDYHRRCDGLSQYVFDAFTFDDLVDDAEALLDHVGVERAVVSSVSAGGPLALQFALSHPERVRALVLVCAGAALMSTTPYTDPTRITPAVEARIEEVKRRMGLVYRARDEGERALFDRLRDRIRNQQSRAAPGSTAEERHQALLKKIEETSDDDLFTYFTGELHHLAANDGVNLTVRLGEIAVPTLIVHGTADRTVPSEYGHDLAREIANAEIVTIEGAGHDVFSDPRAQQAIQEWLRTFAASVT